MLVETGLAGDGITIAPFDRDDPEVVLFFRDVDVDNYKLTIDGHARAIKLSRIKNAKG